MNLEYLINADAIPTEGADGIISELVKILLTVEQTPTVTEEVRQLRSKSNKWSEIFRAALIPSYLSWFSPLLIRDFNTGTIAFLTGVVVTYFVSKAHWVNRHRSEIYQQVLDGLNTNNNAAPT